MKINEVIELKTGETLVLRTPEVNEAHDVLKLYMETATETNYMGREPEDVKVTLEEEKKAIADAIEDPRKIFIVAYIKGEAIGWVSVMPMHHDYVKYRHRAEFSIAILEQHWGKGIGTELLKVSIQAAKKAGFLQIELEVVVTNPRAFHVYEKFGFIHYGKRPRAFKLKDGSFVDENLMMLILDI